jgi:hypothetical protein
MRRLTLLLTAIAALAPTVLAQSTGPYKVLKTARVGGEGGTDYITRTLSAAGCTSRAVRRKRAKPPTRRRRCPPSKSA